MQGRLRTRPADLHIQQTSSLHSLELEELSGWTSPGSQSQAVNDFVRLCLGSGILLDIGNDLTLRLSNPMMESSMAVCGETQRAAIIHPGGRALLYRPRLEVQVEDQVSVKTAKLFPPGRASFTADSCALVYSLDKGGLRSTTDVFHDLHADNIVDTLFQESCLAPHTSLEVSRRQMYESQFWRTPVSYSALGPFSFIDFLNSPGRCQLLVLRSHLRPAVL